MNFDVEIEPFSLALSRSLTTAHGTITHRKGFLVRIKADDVVGIGEATPLPGWTESLRACRTALERVVSLSETSSESDSESSAIDIDTVFDSCPAARHGFVLALFDLHARRAEQPLYRYLGESGTERVELVPVNATIGDGSVEATVETAERALDRGYSCLKCKVGVRSVEADVERLRAVRERCSTVELRADANGAWDREQAARALEGFEAVGVSYVEQPLSPTDVAGHTDLRKMDVDVGVALDETLAEIPIERIPADAADVLVLKPMVLGGIDRVAAILGEDSDSTTETLPVVTTTIDGAYARAGAVHTAASISNVPACGLATGDRLAEDLVLPEMSVVNGRIAVPQGNGNGVPNVNTTNA